MASARSRKGSLFIFGVIFFVFLLGILDEGPKAPVYDISDFQVEMDTDKEVYGSYELVRILVVVDSPADVDDASLTVWGIRPGNYAHINRTRPVNLTQGENRFLFGAKTPYCTSGCGGVYPGPYDVVAELTVGLETVSAKTVINLVRG